MNSISLVLATYNRTNDVLVFLESLERSIHSSDINIEVLIIDQSDQIYDSNYFKSFYPNLDISYYHTPQKGLSRARNIGVKFAKYDILGFPDDDCMYYPDTINNVTIEFNKSNCDFLIGRIYCRKNKLNIIKKWPSASKNVTFWNYFFLSSSITIFIKKAKLIPFDEELGAGTYYGSCEDLKFIHQLLVNQNKGLYNPRIELWHPMPSKNKDYAKIESYARGFSKFILTNFTLYNSFFLMLSILNRFYKLIKERDFFHFYSYFKGILYFI